MQMITASKILAGTIIMVAGAILIAGAMNSQNPSRDFPFLIMGVCYFFVGFIYFLIADKQLK